MAKFVYFEVSSGVFQDKESGAIATYDKVNLMFSKRVNKSNMCGEKGELYSSPINDIPYLFGQDACFPAPAGDDYSKRIQSVFEYLKPYLGKSCTIEEIRKNDRPIISYIEFDE